MKNIGLFFLGCFFLLVSTLALASPVNVNTANVQELATLAGIGPTRAQAIVDYRDSNEPFRSLDDLTKVPGVGQKIISDNADRITFGDESSTD